MEGSSMPILIARLYEALKSGKKDEDKENDGTLILNLTNQAELGLIHSYPSLLTPRAKANEKG